MRSLPPSSALLLVALASTPACVEIDGGAVEARWDLQFGGEDCTPPGASDPLCVRGNRISCERGNIGFVELKLDPLRGSDDPCARDGSPCRFACAPLIGTTRFFIPEGDYSISLQVRDPSGTLLGPADGVAVPAPIVRQVLEGQLTNLNVNLIIVQGCNGC